MSHYLSGCYEVFQNSAYRQSVQTGFLLGCPAVKIRNVLEEFTNGLSGLLNASVLTNAFKLIGWYPSNMYMAQTRPTATAYYQFMSL
jgi:hypothetical protein